MTRRNLVPAVLLLSLTATSATRATPASARTSAAFAVGASVDRFASRRSRSAGRDELSASLVEQAGQYLRATSNGAIPSPELQHAWERFYRSCDSLIRKFTRKVARQQVDVDDCAQNVWADLLRVLPEFKVDRSRGKFTSWLYTIVRSKASNQLRRLARDGCEAMIAAARAVAPEGDDPARQFDRQSQCQAVRSALARLQQTSSDRSFRILHLRQIEGRSVREVADLLAMKSGQVCVTEHRMKRKLRNLLSE